MQYHKQLFLHRPEEGVWGDCHRTAIACLLDLPPEEVPHVFDKGVDGPLGHARMDTWLERNHGLRQVSIVFMGEDSLETVLAHVNAMNPGLKFLLGGMSSNGTDHTVVAGSGKILHDPAQDNSGIVGPCSDGFWWVTFLGRAT